MACGRVRRKWTRIDAELLVVRREHPLPLWLLRSAAAQARQKKGRCKAASCRVIAYFVRIARGSTLRTERADPAFDTAIASALPCDPAIGAWMIGSFVITGVA